MKYNPKFKRNDPKTKEEKLIVEICADLHEISKTHIRINQDCTDHELFLILRDSAIGFAGQSIEALAHLMADPIQVVSFLKECQDIFNCYIDQTLESLDEKAKRENG
jgi:hypothetical protein